MDPEEFAQEYECSFDAALKGSIFATEINLLFAERRVRTFQDPRLFDPNLPTHVVFDLGFTDATVTIWWQEPKEKNRPINIVRCYANEGQDILHYIDDIQAYSAQRELGDVWLPHDARAKNLQTGRSIVEQFLENGIRPRIVPPHKVRDGISAARRVFPRIYIDEETTGELLEALKAYRREWSDDLGMFVDRPVHDWASHYGDAFRYLGVVSGKETFASPDPSPQSRIAPHTNYNLETLFTDNEAQRRFALRRIS
jgi:hypothetical protein